MGMANSDDEGAIMQRYLEQQWAEEFPEKPGSYDHPASEEARAVYHEEVKKHMEKKPRRRNRHGDR
jgi:hypothetical protein